MADAAESRPAIEAAGTQLAFVHLASEEKAGPFFRNYRLEDVPRFGDPDGKLYAAFGLERGRARQILMVRSWWRFVEAGIFRRHGVGIPVGDPFRLGGVFLIHRGRILKAARHETTSDRPDYKAMARAEG